MSPSSQTPARLQMNTRMLRRAAGLIALGTVLAQLMGLAGKATASASPASAPTANVAPNAPSTNRVQIDVEGWLARLAARKMKPEPDGRELFAGTSWLPPPKPEARPPPPALQMPPFPYQVLGRISVGENRMLALEQGINARAVRAGDIIESFRIERIGANSFLVSHLPTGMTREYRYDALPPKTPSALPATIADLAPQSIIPPLVKGYPGAVQPAPPAKAPAQAAGSGSNVMVPLGGVVAPAPAGNPAMTPDTPSGGMIIAPSLRESAPPRSRAAPSIVPQP